MKICENDCKMERGSTRVLVAGTFDFFHKGHEFFLLEAKKRGDELFVIIARDSNVEKIKKKQPQENERIRRQNVQNFPAVKQCFLGDEQDFFRIPQKINPDVICLGYDQKTPPGFLENFPNTTIVRIDSFYPEKYKSSLFRVDG